jgi:hypothetical protein
MKITALLLSLALAVPAAADHVVPFPDASKILVPPAQYDRNAGVRYLGKFTRKIVPHADVYRICSNNGANTKIGLKVLACAKRSLWNARTQTWGKCVVVMPAGMPDALRIAVNRHEVGHCNGWVHTNTTGGVQALYDDDHLHHGGE